MLDLHEHNLTARQEAVPTSGASSKEQSMSCPPYIGSRQVRLRSLNPAWQVTEQSPHSDQSPQVLSTIIREGKSQFEQFKLYFNIGNLYLDMDSPLNINLSLVVVILPNYTVVSLHSLMSYMFFGGIFPHFHCK